MIPDNINEKEKEASKECDVEVLTGFPHGIKYKEGVTRSKMLSKVGLVANKQQLKEISSHI